jgi:hypothetical protein
VKEEKRENPSNAQHNPAPSLFAPKPPPPCRPKKLPKVTKSYGPTTLWSVDKPVGKNETAIFGEVKKKKKKRCPYYIGVSNSIFMKIRSPKVPLRLKKIKKKLHISVSEGKQKEHTGTQALQSGRGHVRVTRRPAGWPPSGERPGGGTGCGTGWRTGPATAAAAAIPPCDAHATLR